MKSKLILLSTLLCSCVVTDVGNPEDEREDADLVLRAYDSSLPNALTFDSGLQITHAWVSVEEIQLRPCEGEDEELDDMELENYVVDLISGRSFPGTISILSDMRFCELSMEFKPAETLPSGAPVDLDGFSVLVRAVRDDKTPVLVRGDFSESLRLRGEVERRDREALLIGFAANEWFGPDIATLSPQDGEIVISPESESESYEDFRNAFKDSTALFRDEDRDGEFDDDEREPVAEPED